MKKFLATLIGASAIFVIVLAFIPVSGSSLVNEIFTEPTYNSLSGREGVDGPILVVKIDDTNAAHPQIGVEDADVVYVEQVEENTAEV